MSRRLAYSPKRESGLASIRRNKGCCEEQILRGLVNLASRGSIAWMSYWNILRGVDVNQVVKWRSKDLKNRLLMVMETVVSAVVSFFCGVFCADIVVSIPSVTL